MADAIFAAVLGVVISRPVIATNSGDHLGRGPGHPAVGAYSSPASRRRHADLPAAKRPDDARASRRATPRCGGSSSTTSQRSGNAADEVSDAREHVGARPPGCLRGRIASPPADRPLPYRAIPRAAGTPVRLAAAHARAHRPENRRPPPRHPRNRRPPRPATYIVASGFGQRAQWFRNLRADPRVRVWTGSRSPTLVFRYDVLPRAPCSILGRLRVRGGPSFLAAEP